MPTPKALNNWRASGTTPCVAISNFLYYFASIFKDKLNLRAFVQNGDKIVNFGDTEYEKDVPFQVQNLYTFDVHLHQLKQKPHFTIYCSNLTTMTT